MKSEFPTAVPEIPGSNINEVVAYYQSNLGFTLDWGDEDSDWPVVTPEHVKNA